MKIKIYQVDAFTNKLFKGNPAAVCVLEKWLDDRLLQSIAAENNLSETAYYVPNGEGFEIRWFTPGMEVDLCGHATLATAHVIFSEEGYEGNTIRFSSKSGELVVRKEGDLLSMDFPSRPPKEISNIPDALIEGLGARPLQVLKSRDYVAVFDNETEVIAIQPDFERLLELDALGIIITAKGDKADFVSRFFAPVAGIDEDPVTGSAHSTLIPYWSAQLGKNKLHALQLSKRRGELFCELKGDRVMIAGHAVTYLEGVINV